MTQKCCEKCFGKIDFWNSRLGICDCPCHTQSNNQDWRERFRKELRNKEWSFVLCNEGLDNFEDCACCMGVPISEERYCECVCHKRIEFIETFIQQELDRQRQDIREIVKGMAMDIDEQGIGYFKAIKDLLEKL